MEEIIDIILEPSSDEINKKNKILDIFLNIINDLSKEETITFIKKLFTLIKANNSELLIRVLPKILELTESYYEEISEIIYECNFTDYFLKKYKKIDLSDLDLFCSYNYLLEVLKKINNKYLICDSFSECKKLNNTQSKYYMVLSKTNNLNGKIYLLFDEIQKVKNWEDEDEVESYLIALLNQQAFDRAGLIYGMGHAVYSISDPRARTFRKFVQKLADEKGLQKEFALYNLVEKLAPKVIANERHIYKGVSANIDFYSGLVYSMLGIPHELYTPIFAIGRIAGWSAHRLEELVNAGKIIRPAYKAVAKHKPYTPLSERD